MKYLLPFLLTACVSASAQLIRGTISDPDGKPVPDVHIRIANTNLGTVSDQDGKFVLRDLVPGASLHLSAIGYADEELLVKDSVVEVTLKPSALFLNNTITVTAQRFEKSSFQVQEAVSVLNAQELMQNVPRSTPEALMGSTGVWVQKTNHGGGSPIVRGLVGNQILLMIDGIRMNNATYRYGPNQYLATVDPGLIERIEATRGNGSVLYGSDALGGVVQVISKTPTFSSNGFRVSGRAQGKWMSSEMETSGRAEVHVSGERIAILGGFSIRKFGDIVAGGDVGTLDPTGYKERSGDAKILLRTGANGLLTAAYQHHVQHDVPRYDQVVQGGYNQYDFEPQSRQLSYMRWETSSINPLFQSMRVTGSFNRTIEGVNSQRNGSVDIRRMEDVVDTWSFIAEAHSTIAQNWQAQSGIEYYHDFVKSETLNTNTTTGIETSLRGSYADGSASDNLALFTNHIIDWNKFQLSAGTRFNTVKVMVQDATFGNEEINPRALVGNAGLTYKFHPNYHFTVSTNTGFRAPNVDDMSKFGAVEGTVFEVPSASLSPERSFSLEAGIKTQTEKFSGSLTAYRTKLKDLIDRIPVVYQGQDTIENRRVYQKQNVGEAELYGVEADAEVGITSSLIAFGNVTYTHGQNLSKNEPMRRIPPLFGKAGLRYRHASGFWAKAEWLAAAEQTRLAAGDLSDPRISVRLKDGVMPGWSVLNFYAGYSYKKLSLSVSAQNIFDEGYRVYASGVDGIGRSFWTTVGIRL